MGLHELSPPKGARRNGNRKGRGPGSGNGKTAGRGQKGQKARSGGNIPRGFEGGQMPLHRRLPKVGFSNHKFRTTLEAINVRELNVFEEGTVVDWAVLKEAGIARKSSKSDGLKIIGDGELSVALTVRAEKFSGTAREKIEAAGGTAEVI